MRIISLVPSNTEILFYLGLENQLVGVTEQCDFPVEVSRVDKIGDFVRPDLGKVLALQPDLVWAQSAMHKSLIEELKGKNIQVFATDPKTMADVFANMEEIAERCGVLATAQPLINSLRNQVERQETNSLRKERPRVLRLMNTDPFITPGPGSFQYDAVRIAGGEQITARDQAYIMVSWQEIVEFDPEVILFCGIPVGSTIPQRCKGCNMPNPICQRTINDIATKEWEQLSAVRNNKVFPISCDTICRPGPRMVQGIQRIQEEYLK